jgi:predicted amidophosphoribosyltransferase
MKTNIILESNNETITETKKTCKTCGNELPSIVSICPNCGTDNE